MTLPNGRPDPFAGGESTPSVSFKDKPHGTSYTLEVVDYPDLVQSTDFETGTKAVWPDGNPKMSAVVPCVVKAGPDGVGEKRSLWAAKPSALFGAVQAAQNAAGAQIAPGGTLVVTYTHDEPNKTNPRLNPAKQYRTVYTPPNAFAQPAPAAQYVQTSTAPVTVNPGYPPAAPAAQPVAAKTPIPAAAYAAMVANGMDVSAFEIAG